MTSPNTETERPRCRCGYDLAGIEGPPWRCPECGVSNVPAPTWWRPRNALFAMTRMDRGLAAAGTVLIVGGVIASVAMLVRAAPTMPGLVVLLPMTAVLAGAALCATAAAAWITRGERSWRFAKGVLPWLLAFGLAIGAGLVVAIAAAFLAITLRP